MKLNWKEIFCKKHLVMIGVGVLINFALFLLGYYLNLPVWLDTTGTILVAVTCGLIPSFIVGIINGFLCAIFFGWESLAFIFVSFALATVFWFFARKERLNNLLSVSGAMLVGILVKALTCTLVYLALGKALPDNTYEVIVFMGFKENTMGLTFAAFWSFLFSNMLVSLLDGIGTVIFVVLAYKFIYTPISNILRCKNMQYYVIDAQVEQLENVQGFVEKQTEELDLSPKISAQIAIAVEEIFVNICKHAYRGEGGFAKIGFRATGGSLELEFIDRGFAFDPTAVTADTTSSLEERKIGGLGIHMVKKSMDSVDYRFENGQNILTLKKRYETK